MASDRFTFLLHSILSAAFICKIFGCSAAESSSFGMNKQIFVPSWLQKNLSLDSWNVTTLQPSKPKKGDFLEEGSKKTQLQGGAVDIKQRMTLRLIHRTSPLSPHSKNHSAQVDLLKELMELDALRLNGYRFSSWSQGNSKRRHLASSNSAIKAAEFGIIHRSKSPGSVIYKISSGASVGSGQYFVDFYMGTPAEKYTMIADTGSDLIWVQCYPCKRCYPQSNPIYYPKNSSSFAAVPCTADHCFQVPAPPHASCNPASPTSCRYTYRYNDHTSTTGFLASETVTMRSSSGGWLKLKNVTFGCGIRNKGRSLRGSNGVLALGQGDVSFVHQLGHSYGSKFSYCLVDYLKPSKESSLLVFGEPRIQQSVKNAIQYTPLARNVFAETYYYVGIQHVRVNGRVLPISSHEWQIDASGYGGTIVDSGTTLTYFRQEAYALILPAFRKAIKFPRVAPIQGLDLCFNVSGSSGRRSHMPEFSILLKGNVHFHPPPQNYLVDAAPEVKCLAIQGVASALGSNIIGNLLQQNFHVEFDRLNARLGFVWANCSSSP